MFDSNPDSLDFTGRFSAGEPVALVALWEYGRKHFIPLYKQMGFTREQAEDLWSETYLKLLQTKCRTYNSRKGAFPAWLRVVARRAGQYRLRHRAKRPEVSLDDCLNLPSREIFVEENTRLAVGDLVS